MVYSKQDMGDINIAEIAELGAKIAELGTKLQSLRAKRETLDEQIKAVEEALLPVVSQHAALLSAITGAVLPAASQPSAPPAAAYAAPEVSGVLTPNSGAANVALSGVDTVILKKKIQTFLQGREGASALEIAESLHVDPMHVRHVLIQMSQGG